MLSNIFACYVFEFKVLTIVLTGPRRNFIIYSIFFRGRDILFVSQEKTLMKDKVISLISVVDQKQFF